MPRITKKLVESLIPPLSGQKIYRDDDTNGFALRMTPGSTSYVVEERIGGVRRRITIGHYPAMPVEQARIEARRVLAKMRMGLLPGDKGTGPTLEELMQRFFAERNLSPKTVSIYGSVLRRCLPDWLELPITAITKQMIQERHRALVRPTRCGGDNKSDADRAFHTLRVMLNFAKLNYEVAGKPVLEENPVRGALHWRWYGTAVRTGVIPDHRLGE